VARDPAMTAHSDAQRVRPGEDLDWAALEAWLRAELPELTGDFAVGQFPHGAANLTYLVDIGVTSLVVRRPPFGVIAPGAHDMRREYRVLSRLHRVYDRAPRALLYCEDERVIGAPFLVVEFRPGAVVRAELPAQFHGSPEPGALVGRAVVDALADLHLADPAAAELGDLGRPDGFVDRQLRGWTQRWNLVAPNDRAHPLARLGAALAGHVPHQPRTAILHLDFKIDNCQFPYGRVDRVGSVFDWDMATLGDPLVDLGTLLNYWPEAGDDLRSQSTSVGGLERLGLPTRAEVVQQYASRTGIDCSAVNWYEAFGCWKTAIALRQLEMRFERGETTDERMRDAGAAIVPLAERGLTLLTASADRTTIAKESS
jgi:aminoglycoside phosphotransferase (APT) family kinase protein